MFPNLSRSVRIACALLFLCHGAWAWNPPTDTAGPLTVTISDFGDVQKLDTPIPVQITLENKGGTPVHGSLRIGVIDNWRVEGQNPRGFSVAANGKTETTVTVVAGKGSYAAWYPVHAYADFEAAGEKLEAHAVLLTQVTQAAVGVVKLKPKGFGQLTALQAVAPIKLDGNLDSWTNAAPVPLGEAQCSTGSFGPGDFGAILYLLHDEQNLYIGLRVTDDDISADDVTSNDYMDSDYLRLYLSPRPPAERKDETLTRDDVVVAINPFAKGGPLLKVPDYGFATQRIANLKMITVVPKRTATGYDLEVAVPLSLIGPKSGSGSTLGFNLMLGDADHGHREAEMTIGDQTGQYWTNPQSYVALQLSAGTKATAEMALPVTTISHAGATPLDRLGVYHVEIERAGQPLKMQPLGWTGTDAESGATFRPMTASRPDARSCINTHPAYRHGVGPIHADARFALPDIRPITLTFATAIRDNTAKEPPSDGVEWRVYVAGANGEFKQLFQRFSAGKHWDPAEVDLSAYAGQTITLRLWNGPGPKNNTTCDSGYWAEPTLVVGNRPVPESPAAVAARHNGAMARARAAWKGKHGEFQWQVKNAAGTFGIGWQPGEHGFADGALAVAADDKGRDVVFDHFLIQVDANDLRDWRSNAQLLTSKPEWNDRTGAATVRDTVQIDDQKVPVEVQMFAEDGVFKLQFSMPGVTRNNRGKPRFTLIGVGPCTEKAKRIYAGFGNVIEDPESYTLTQGGPRLGTKDIGIDFANGLSLVEASDVFPYQFVVDPDQKLYSLQTGHDATLMLIPSVKGAFAAGRIYREVSGTKAAGGVAKLEGKMAIDWWGGHDIAADIRRADAYGLHDCVFIKHNWQRWGYDYRLPDIYPPNCDPKVWNDWVRECKDAGMLCAVHDNYIDFYPDASNFSYKYILFNRDGTPQRAWFNKGRKAQSYRWLPGAYWPWLQRNLKLEMNSFKPTAYFIDVFSAIPLLDYYDQAGNYHMKMECAEQWGATFDYVRKTLGNDAPTISESGHVGLVGHLDGCESDHYSAKTWGWKCADAERVPWEDMATHGRFVLLAGGLGPRYSGGDPNSGWGTDDYLSDTVIGGRNPMCTGPCRRMTVMTYWLQHDICNALAHQSFDSLEFVGDDIHRQHSTFGGGGQVWMNRGDTPWSVQGVTLPKFGYIARSGDTVSSITLKDGLSVRYAQSPDAMFVDSRPTSVDVSGVAPVKTHVVSARYLGNGQMEVDIEWDVLKPVATGYRPFVHLCNDKVVNQNEEIALYPTIDLQPQELQQVGKHISHVRFTIPDNMWDGDYYLRYGLYKPGEGGGRIALIAQMDDSRVRGGIYHVAKEDGKVNSIEYRSEEPPAGAAKHNIEEKMVDFGAIVTDGAFRLVHSGAQWQLFPLQGSLPFHAEIRLDRLGATGRRVASVQGLSEDGGKLADKKFQQNGEVLSLDLDAAAFSYRITFRP